MVDVSRRDASYKISLMRAHFVLGPMIINDLRLCRNVDRLRYKLYAPILIRALGKKWDYWIFVINVFLYVG